ncbi:coiled-coil domain-containing protein 17 [Hoplias malabaricus]|uniref:coiled-coil domain-containing protein 17 n=1 Tax=Hoplias malabaricus TaxID=27720 RepID=UPI0034624447
MEHLGVFLCPDCNMTFRSFGLLDKHKTWFCIGSDIQNPGKIRGRVEIGLLEKRALRGVSLLRILTPDVISLREQKNRLLRQKDMRETDPQDNSTESLAINRLTDKRINKEMLQEKWEHHRQKLTEIRARTTQLKQQRNEIEQRLAERSGPANPTHLENLLQELKEQEVKNEEILHQLSSQINGLQGMKEHDVFSNPLEDKMKQHVSIDLNSVDGPVSSQIRLLRLAYLQSGGSDPEILAHMHDLQAEAYTMEQARAELKMGRRRTKPSHQAMDSVVMAMEQENQRLEKDILRLQLVRERHRGENGLTLIQRHKLHQLDILQAEISSLRRCRKSDIPLLHPPDHILNHLPMSRHVLDPVDNLVSAPYDPVAGFVIFYNMVLGVDATVRTICLAAGLYSGGQGIGQPILVPPVQCQRAGVLPFLLSRNPGNYAILAFKQPVPRIQPSPDISLVLEVQAAGAWDLSGQEIHGLVSRGWTKLLLFDQHNQVQTGFWRVPVHCLPMRPSISPGQLNTVPRLGNMEICLCVVNARDADAQNLNKIDPNNTSHYKSPPMVVPHSATLLQGQGPYLPTSDYINPVLETEDCDVDDTP